MYPECSLFLSTGSDLRSVVQNPPDLIINQDEVAEIKCTHIVKSYDRILWYKHSQDTGFKYMGYILNTFQNLEKEFENKIKLNGDGRNNGSLTIISLSVNDSGVYFCAAYYTGLKISSLHYKNLYLISISAKPEHLQMWAQFDLVPINSPTTAISHHASNIFFWKMTIFVLTKIDIMFYNCYTCLLVKIG